MKRVAVSMAMPEANSAPPQIAAILSVHIGNCGKADMGHITSLSGTRHISTHITTL